MKLRRPGTGLLRPLRSSSPLPRPLGPSPRRPASVARWPPTISRSARRRARRAVFVAAINQLRTSKGLNPLAVDGNLTGIAPELGATDGAEATASRTVSTCATGSPGMEAPRRKRRLRTDGQRVDGRLHRQPRATTRTSSTRRFTHVGVGTVRTRRPAVHGARVHGAASEAAPARLRPSAAGPGPSPTPVGHRPAGTHVLHQGSPRRRRRRLLLRRPRLPRPHRPLQTTMKRYRLSSS